MRLTTIAVLLVALALSGCAGRRSTVEQNPGVGWSEIRILPSPEPDPAAAAVGTLPAESAPEVVDQAPPSYPASALDDLVDCTARILYHIQTDGSAELVRLQWEPPPPSVHLEVFEAAIHEAIAGWAFVPGQQLAPWERPDGAFGFEWKPILAWWTGNRWSISLRRPESRWDAIRTSAAF
jgi:hypothetical protein